MWLVGYLHNNNGMGTWCWEAAHALAHAGEPVTLVCSDTVTLPGLTTLPIMRIAATRGRASKVEKIHGELRRMSAAGPPMMYEAIQLLEREGTTVRIALLNATEFYDPRITVPQLVTAWAQGVTARAYTARLRIHLRGLSRQSVRAVTGAIGWWRKDWRAFRGADVILSVTSPLATELRSHGVAAMLLHPCTHAAAAAPVQRPAGVPVRLLMTAASLDEPRKRVGWMLDAMRAIPANTCVLTLVGEASDVLRRQADRLACPVDFTGPLSRDDVMRVMRDNDVFVFGSLLDDWGYVITEAMGQGLAVVAPRLAPFDEIVGETGLLYDAVDPNAFRRTIIEMLPQVESARLASWRRAQSAFSRDVFVARLREIVAAHDAAQTPHR